MELPSLTKTFRVRRQEPVLVLPARPTPMETKPLSDIDDQEGLRFPMTFIHFYKSRPNISKEEDPAKVIRAALAEALVSYYPFAGRLRELPDKKLVVDCSGEGVLFVEADADVTLEELGEDIHPPFPCLEDLLYDVPDSDGIINCPLLTIQVTRLECGGFVFALNLNHTMSDSIGLVQFEKAIAEIARGDFSPSVTPVWERELLNARDPPTETCVHREFIPVADTKRTIFPFDPREFVHKSFFFGPHEIAALRSSLPPDLKCSSFEVLIASLWRCRTVALEFDPDEEVRTLYFVNARSRFNPPLPEGFYGNAIASPAVLTTAGELVNNPLSYAVELVKKPKTQVTEEYMKSLADLMVLRGRPRLTLVSTYMVSDLTRIGFDDVDFGWGKPTYAGPARAAAELIPGVATYFTPKKTKQGERGIVVPVCLPKLAMDKFAEEIESMLKRPN